MRDELLRVIHAHYPRGLWTDDPAHAQTEETRRLRELQHRAAADRGPIRRLEAALADLVPGAAFHDMSHPWYEASYQLQVVLPPSAPEEPRHVIVVVSLSLLGPYYRLHQLVARQSSDGYEERYTYAPDADVEPYFALVSREVETLLGFRRVEPEVGEQTVADVQVGNSGLGDATFYDCVFGPISADRG